MEQIEIGPNKRAGFIMLVITLAFFLYAYLNYNNVNPSDCFEIGHLFIVRAKILYKIDMLFFPVAFIDFIYLNLTKNHMYITRDTLITV